MASRGARGPTWPGLALAVLVVTTGIVESTSQARAEPFIYYGGQTPCSLWLATLDTYKQGLSWIMGAWSGLNMLGGLRHDTHYVGHTLTADQVANAVQYSCRKDMSLDMNAALLEAYVSARVQKR